MPDHARITVICALPSEAAPLVEHWQLRLTRAQPFQLWQHAQRQVLVSGVGSHACAAAVGYAAAVAPTVPIEVWCNAGIAGHRQLALGSAIVAERVTQHGRDDSWYPCMTAAPPCRTAALVTYDQPVIDYPADGCVDMEAAGFMAAVARVSNSDLVGVFKVISDNAKHALAGIERARVQALIGAHLALFDTVIDGLLAHAHNVPAFAPEQDAALAHWHFTRMQARQLRQIAQRRNWLTPTLAWPHAALARCQSAAEVLARLRAELPAPPPHGPAPA